MTLTPEEQAELAWLEQLEAWRNDPQGILHWALGLQLRNERGDPMEWADHRFLLDILCDLHPRQVVVKCTQVGLSTIQILRSAFMAQVMGYGIIYTLPTKELVGDFAATKVGPILENNPLLRPGAEDSVGKRVYGPGFVLYRGTFGERQAIMISADLLVCDEADRSNIGVLNGLESRLSASPYKGQWWFTNPTRPKVGTDLLWQKSDQRRWHVTCPHCGEVQPLDFWANVDPTSETYVCRKCRGPLSDDARRDGEWIATKPGAAWHGYHINQLMAPWISAAEILELERTKSKEYFYNFVLGLPVIGEGLSVDSTLILRALVESPEERAKLLPGRQRFMGVDVGGALHVCIGNESGITRLLTLPGKEKWNDLHRLMRQVDPALCVIDNGPVEKQTEFQQAFPHKVLRCIYDYDHKRQETWEEPDDDEGVIYAHRTRIIDEVLDEYAKGGIKVLLDAKDPWLNGTGKPDTVENCLTGHWSTLYVVGADGQDVNMVKKDRMGNVIRTWENAGPDHFAHANVYYWLARQAGHNARPDAVGVMAGGFAQRRRKSEDDDDDDDQDRKGRRSVW